MSKSLRLLVNGLTLDDANLIPLIQKISFWQSQGVQVTVLGSQYLKARLEKNLRVSFVNPAHFVRLHGQRSFLIKALLRNLSILPYLRHLPKTEVIYSVSSVLDLIIVPYLQKCFGLVKYWGTVFDNTVPLLADGRLISGNPFSRVLAWIFFQISLLLLKKADRIFVVKPELKSYLIKRGFASSKLIVTGNGVEKTMIVKARQLKKFRYDALYLGRLNEAKGIYDLLAVIKIIKKKLPHFQLALVGDGDENTLRHFIARIDHDHLTDNVIFLGFRSGQEKYDIIKSCKIFLFLSHTESVPVAPLEAVCSGKITIVYKLDAYKMYSHREVVPFKIGDFEGIAKYLLKLYKKGDFRNPAGAKLINIFNWTAIAKTEYQFLFLKN